MANASDSDANIIAEVKAEIRAVNIKEKRVEDALEGRGPYLGTTDHVRQGGSCGGRALIPNFHRPPIQVCS